MKFGLSVFGDAAIFNLFYDFNVLRMPPVFAAICATPLTNTGVICAIHVIW